MIPGELISRDGELELNRGRVTIVLDVANTGDRPIQVGSHYHFAETNGALAFDRAAARGFRLNIAAGTAVRFEPGQKRTVELVALGGARVVQGFTGAVMGPLEPVARKAKGIQRSKAKGERKPATKATKTPAAPRAKVARRRSPR